MTDAPGGYLPPSDRGLGDGSEGYVSTAAPADSSPSSSSSPSSPSSDSPSRGEAAKEQASQLGQTAKDSGQQVASTATDHAKNVAQETRRQAKDLTREVSSQVSEQAAVQKDKASTGLRSLSDELRSMAANSEQAGPATDLAHQAADKLGDVAQWLESREPGHLVDEVRGLARRKPGTFLIGAAVAGAVVGRLTRGAVQAARSDENTSQSNGSTYVAGGRGLTYGPGGTSLDGPQSGTLAGETYPSDDTPIATATEADVIVVEDTRVSSGAYGSGQER
jgi:gas vesicle protein